jgi:hypothetical protein
MPGLGRVTSDCQRVADALRAGLAESLAPDGWRRVGGDDDHLLVALVRPVADEFVATFEVRQAASFPDRPPVLVTYVHAGVGYEPLRRLAPLLGMFGLAVQSTLVWPESVAQDEDEDEDEDEEDEEDEEDDEDDEDEFQHRELRTLDEADQLAGELAVVARERAVPYARRYADLDLLLATVSGPRSGTVRRAALLASAGRFDEARVSLAQLAPAALGHWMPDEQRAVRQLERWIESGGDPALIPDEPPPSRSRRSPSPSMSRLWHQSRATSATVNTVKRAGKGKDRAQLRAMLERELAMRGVKQSPLWFEQTLDHLHDTPAETAEIFVKGLMTAGKFGIKVIRGIRDERPLLDQLPDLSVPEWLNPPARAAWPVPQQLPEVWMEVQTARGDAGWLDRAYRAIPRLIGSVAFLEAWFDWDTDEQRHLAVDIGERRVGTLDETATTAYRAEMTAASSRDESPYTRARLTPRPTRKSYLLEVQLPA